MANYVRSKLNPNGAKAFKFIEEIFLAYQATGDDSQFSAFVETQGEEILEAILAVAKQSEKRLIACKLSGDQIWCLKNFAENYESKEHAVAVEEAVEMACNLLGNNEDW